MLTTNSHPKIYLLSDTHLIADELHDNGAAFQKMRDKRFRLSRNYAYSVCTKSSK